MKHFFKFIALAAMVAAAVGCNPEPKESSIEFASKTYGYNEDQVYGYIGLMELNTPESFPVVVDVKATFKAGKDHEGNALTLKQLIAFDRGDEESYTVAYPDDNTAIISGIEVTYSQYNKRLYFSILDNDFLQSETAEIKFELTAAKGANIGDYTESVLTIVDDEHAPRIKTPYYLTEYTPLTGSTNPDAGKFYLRLDKVGKYQYVASGWFGLPRPRLLGRFDPETQTLTFHGSDYDHQDMEPEDRVSAFRNDTLWYYNAERTQILRLFAGTDGEGPLVVKTEKIDENASGTLVEVVTNCGWAIFDFDGTRATDFVGYYDGMNTSSKMTYFENNYDESEFDQVGTRTTATTGPIPFSNWRLEE